MTFNLSNIFIFRFLKILDSRSNVHSLLAISLNGIMSMPNKIQYQLKKLPLISCALLSCLAFGQVHAVSNDQVKQLVESEKKNYLNTLEALVNIESGSKDLVGVNKIAKYVAEQLKMTGAEVSIVEAKDIYRMDDTPQQTGPMVKAVLKGKGSSKIMLIAHMDTVYLTGMLKDQPFKMEGDKVFGLGILDDKQGGRCDYSYA